MQQFSWSFSDEPLLDLDIEQGHPLQRAIMPILLRQGGIWRVVGTAFAVGPQVLLTAKHTLVDETGLRGEEGHVLYVDGRNEDGSYNGGLLPIDHVNTNGQTDLALLQVKLPLIDGALLRLATLPLSFAAPEPDEVCAVLGYTAGMEFEEDPGSVRLEVTPVLHASQGKVVELHHSGRDQSFLPFPVFQTTAHISSQMSGSPILGGAGVDKRVIGVASTGYDVPRADEPISYGSLLWPAAGLRMTVVEQDTPAEISLLELARMGYVAADDSIEQIELDTSDPNGWRVALRP